MRIKQEHEGEIQWGRMTVAFEVVNAAPCATTSWRTPRPAHRLNPSSKRRETCPQGVMFALDRKDKPPNSFRTKRSALFMRHVQHMIAMQSPAGSAGDPARLSYSIRITAKTTIKTV